MRQHAQVNAVAHASNQADAASARRGARWILGTAWAMALAWVGLWLWDATQAMSPEPGSVIWPVMRSASVFLLAASQFVFMALVADDICRRASPWITGLLKTTAGALTWLALGFALLWPVIQSRSAG